MDSPTTDPSLDPEFRRVLEEMRNRYMRRPITTTGNLTLGARHGTVLGDATGGAITITVPKSTDQIGRQYIVKKIDASANAVTLSASGSDTIDGAATYALSARYDSVTIQSNASGAWEVIAKVTAGGGGGGEANTASNVNVGGVGVFKQKTGVNLEFRGVNAGSSKITVALDTPNNEIDVDASQQAILDAVGSTRGSFLERGVGGWALLTPGSANFILISNGAGADPSYVSLSSHLDTVFGSTRGAILERGASVWALVSPGSANTVFTSNGAGADPSYTGLSALIDTVFGNTRGSLLTRGASGWTVLAPGTSGNVLTSNGAGADPTYQASAGAIWTMVKKTANQSRASFVGVADDSTLTLAMAAATRYHSRGVVFILSANATMDYRYKLNYTGTITELRGQRTHTVTGVGGGTGNVNQLGFDAAFPVATIVTGTTAGVGVVTWDFEILTNTSGTFSFQWSQDTSDVGNLTVTAGSYFEYMTV